MNKQENILLPQTKFIMKFVREGNPLVDKITLLPTNKGFMFFDPVDAKWYLDDYYTGGPSQTDAPECWYEHVPNDTKSNYMIPKTDADFIYSLLPPWVKDFPEGLCPTMYGTLTREGDMKVGERVHNILYGQKTVLKSVDEYKAQAVKKYNTYSHSEMVRLNTVDVYVEPLYQKSLIDYYEDILTLIQNDIGINSINPVALLNWAEDNFEHVERDGNHWVARAGGAKFTTQQVVDEYLKTVKPV